MKAFYCTHSHVYLQQDVDPFLCRCSKCKRFWLDHFSENDLKRLKDPPLLRALKSNCMYAAVQQKEDHAAVLKIGDRVTVNSSQLQGESRFNHYKGCFHTSPPQHAQKHEIIMYAR